MRPVYLLNPGDGPDTMEIGARTTSTPRSCFSLFSVCTLNNRGWPQEPYPAHRLSPGPTHFKRTISAHMPRGALPFQQLSIISGSTPLASRPPEKISRPRLTLYFLSGPVMNLRPRHWLTRPHVPAVFHLKERG